jgi:hypothetical protein
MRIQKLLAAAATVLLTSAGTAYATTVTVTGSYTIGYTPIHGNGPTITKLLSDPFTLTLTIDVPTPHYNFFTANPASTCGSGCVNFTASGTITVSFNFTQPAGQTKTFTETALYQAKYSGPALSCTTSPPGQTDCITWDPSNDPMVVNFPNHFVLYVTFYNAQDWAITPQISFLGVPGPIAGSGLEGVLLALGMTGLVGWRRRGRLKVQASA